VTDKDLRIAAMLGALADHRQNPLLHAGLKMPESLELRRRDGVPRETRSLIAFEAMIALTSPSSPLGGTTDTP
jgi:hypothetical protein